MWPTSPLYCNLLLPHFRSWWPVPVVVALFPLSFSLCLSCSISMCVCVCVCVRWSSWLWFLIGRNQSEMIRIDIRGSDWGSCQGVPPERYDGNVSASIRAGWSNTNWKESIRAVRILKNPDDRAGIHLRPQNRPESIKVPEKTNESKVIRSCRPRSSWPLRILKESSGIPENGAEVIWNYHQRSFSVLRILKNPPASDPDGPTRLGGDKIKR